MKDSAQKYKVKEADKISFGSKDGERPSILNFDITGDELIGDMTRDVTDIEAPADASAFKNKQPDTGAFTVAHSRNASKSNFIEPLTQNP